MSGQKKLALFKDSPFGAPAPRPPSDDDDSDTEFFSQSKRTYALLAAQEQERKKRKAEQATAAVEEPGPATPPSQKKQKTSDLGDAASREDPSQENHDETVESQISPVPSNSQPKTNETNARTSQGYENPSAGEIIELESDESSVEELGIGELPASQPSNGAEGANSDDLKILREHRTEASNASEPNHGIAAQSDSATPDPEANVVISILITSNIPNTAALLVQRKLGQRLKEPRLEWCQRQGFDNAKTGEVILTFRGKQVYDSTSCRVLGIGVDASGNLVAPGEKDAIGDTDRRIHMQATTRDMLKELRKNQSQRAMGVEDEVVALPLAPAETTGKKVRLILKSKGRDDMKLMVKDTHPISKLINAYRKEKGLQDSPTSVSIHFDGEELDPERSVADCDISDLDTLDVYEK